MFRKQTKQSPTKMKSIALSVIAIFSLLLSAIAAGDQSVTLAWDPHPDPTVKTFVVYYGTNSGSYTMATNVGNVTMATIRGLNDGTQYFFAVTAQNGSGLESEFSNEVTNKIPPKPASPIVVTNYWNIPPLKMELLLVPFQP